MECIEEFVRRRLRETKRILGRRELSQPPPRDATMPPKMPRSRRPRVLDRATHPRGIARVPSIVLQSYFRARGPLLERLAAVLERRALVSWANCSSSSRSALDRRCFGNCRRA